MEYYLAIEKNEILPFATTWVELRVLCCFVLFLFFNFFSHLFNFERQWQSVSRVEAEKQGDTGSEAGSRLRADSTEPDVGLEPTTCEIMTWAEVRCPTDWATQAPLDFISNLNQCLMNIAKLPFAKLSAFSWCLIRFLFFKWEKSWWYLRNSSVMKCKYF